MTQQELLESYWLCSIEGLGGASIRRLLEEAGSPEGVRELSAQRREELIGPARAALLERAMEKEAREEAERRLEAFAGKGIRFTPLWSGEYPERLKRIPDPPAGLYSIGRFPPDSRRAVAIVGARACSGYGREMAQYFARGLAREGVAVISGMARGADGIAQQAALAAGGISAAVLGCGVDICYPPENRGLYDGLCRTGCVISEYPPGTPPHARQFPPRNRIISGLADLVLVIEAREQSGTLITVDMALEQGRDVFAVPGRITDTCSRGCNRLIGNGAGAAVSVSQLLSELSLGPGEKNGRSAAVRSRRQLPEEPPPLQEPEKMSLRAAPSLRAALLSVLDVTPKPLDELLENLADQGITASPGAVMQELIGLQLDNRIASQAGQYLKRDILP
ncbi:MAG: DNA-processing protein DprA [Eubacteriales bacterium]|nr:DNA-processing protein DprA [Eubacteriales bacterium]